MGRGAIATSGNDITIKDGSGYTEETVDLSGGKAISWNVTTPAGKTTVNIPEEKGFYILNHCCPTKIKIEYKDAL